MKARTLVVLLAVVLAGCNQEKPKVDPDAPKKATPVPSDLVFNDFLPPTGTSGLSVKVDGGLEGGIAAAGTEENGDVPDSVAMKVLEPGAEPRAVRKYAFAPNRTDRRVLTIRQTQSVQGQKQEQPGLVFTADFTTKEVNPKGGATIEMKVVKVDLADKERIDPRAVQQLAGELAAFEGISATFTVSPHGDIGELSMAGTPRMQREAAAEILQALQVFVELLLPAFPTAPIGVGAKWEREEDAREAGVQLKQKRTLELKEVTAEGGVVVANVTRKIGKQAVQNPKMPPGSTVEMEGTGTSTYTFRFDRLSTKVTAEQDQTIHIEGAGPSGERRKDTVAQHAKYTVESGTAGQAPK